jgi:hypothetical protein
MRAENHLETFNALLSFTPRAAFGARDVILYGVALKIQSFSFETQNQRGKF